MQSGQEHGGVQAVVGDLVAVGVGDPGDEAMGAEASQVAGHLPGASRLRWQAAELGGDGAQVPVGEPVELEPEGQQRGQQSMAALLAQAQPRSSGAGGRVGEGMQVACSGDRVVVESLDALQAPAGVEADLPQGGQTHKTSADVEAAGVVGGGLGSQRPSLLVVALMVVCL